MATILNTYNQVVNWLTTTVTGNILYSNVTVYRGQPIKPVEKPSLVITLNNEIETSNEGTPFVSTFGINLGLKVNYNQESTFLDQLEELVADINNNADLDCGVEFAWVSSISFSQENNNYSLANLVVTVQAYHNE